MITGIIAALPEELSTLTSDKPKKGCCHVIAENILIIQSGAGPKNAEQAAEQLLDQGAERLISWGCAAALAPGLRPGNLTLPEQLISDDLESIDIRSPWLAEIQALLNALTPVAHISLASSNTLVATSKDKKQLHRKTGAAALDMESVAIAKVAKAHRIDFLAIRSIADPADMSLPKAVAHALDPDGEVNIAKLLNYLIKHPLELPSLIQLGRHFHASQKTLKQAASIWLPSIVN
ncbi:MAG: phosphorylase [Gammaproteobacteria bacterium]|nr:phosphorylase [Gammaproteobacteria bacterium]